MEKEPNGGKYAPKSSIGDATDDITKENMLRQAQENAARIEAEKKPPVIPEDEHRERLTQEIQELMKLEADAQKEIDSKLDGALAELERAMTTVKEKGVDVLDIENKLSSQIKPNINHARNWLKGPDRPMLLSLNNFEKYKAQWDEQVDEVIGKINELKSKVIETAEDEDDRMAEIRLKELKTNPELVEENGLEEEKKIETAPDEKKENTKINPEQIRDIAIRAQEVFREAIDAGLPQAEAVAKSRKKLLELTRGAPGLMEAVTREVRINQKESPAPENLKPELIGPETGTPGVAEMPSEYKSQKTETEEERIAREAEAYQLHQEQTMGGGMEKEPPSTETEKFEAPPDLVSKTVQEALELYQNIKAVTGDANAARDKADEYLEQKLKDYDLESLSYAFTEFRGKIQDSDFPPEPEPTPEEKEKIEAAQTTSAEIVAEAVEKADEPESPLPILDEYPDFSEIPEEEIKKEAEKELEKLPEEEKPKLWHGLNNLGFYIEEYKDKFFANAINGAAGKFDKKSSVGRFFSSLAESFEIDAQNARKRIDNEPVSKTQKTIKSVSNIGTLSGNILKYGRVALDVVGYTAMASPVGWVTKYFTTAGMAAARGFDAMKEARLKNEEVIEKTRIQDVDTAASEAWKIYENAQTKAGENNVSKEDLEKAYKENLPQDLLRRLKEDPEPNVASSILQRFTKWHIEHSASNLQTKIDGVENNEKLSQKEKEYEKERLFTKYSKRLKDFDRIVSQYGVVDTAAMLAKYGEIGSKTLVYATMAETLAMGIEKLWSHLAGSAVEKADVIAEKTFSVSEFEKQIGVDSRDGLNETEAARVVEAAKRLKSIGNLKAAEEIERRYGGLVTQDTKKPIGEIFAEKEKTLPKVEETPKPPQKTIKTTPAETPAPPKITKVPTKTWENIIDSQKIGVGSDSVWKSTKEYFLYQTRGQLKEMGFETPADDSQFGAELDKWADKQTANLIEGWKQAHGGQSPDIVHSGDKVVIEFDTENKPHLKILNTEGQEIEPKSLAPAEPEPTDEEITAQEEKLQKQIAAEEEARPLPKPQEPEHITHPITGEDLGPDPHPELHEAPAEIAPTPITPAEAVPEIKPTPETASTTELSPVDEFRKSWERAAKEFYGEEEKAKIVKNYVEKMTASENYPEYGHKIWGEELDTFAHMFPMEGIAQKIEDIDTPQELAEAIARFEKQLTDTTKLLLENSYRKLTPADNPFPIVSAEGEHIYFAYPRGDNKWILTKFDQFGVEEKSIPNPNKLFWARDKREFSVKDIKKLLGY